MFNDVHDLRAALDRRGITQRAIATAMGKTDAYVSRLLTDTRPPTREETAERHAAELAWIIALADGRADLADAPTPTPTPSGGPVGTGAEPAL